MMLQRDAKKMIREESAVYFVIKLPDSTKRGPFSSMALVESVLNRLTEEERAAAKIVETDSHGRQILFE